jgi:hypothetical protein
MMIDTQGYRGALVSIGEIEIHKKQHEFQMSRRHGTAETLLDTNSAYYLELLRD